MTSLSFAITGANGQIGSYLVNALRKEGHIVYELVRSCEKAKDKEFYKFFDLSCPANIPSLLNVDVLIHCAHFFDATSKDYKKINCLGSEALFLQAEKDVVQYSIFISTLSSHATARSLYGQTKYSIEKALMQRNPKIVIIRPGLIFHEPLQGIISAIDKIVERIPIVPLIGGGKQLIYPCLLEDLTKLIKKISYERICIKDIIVAANDTPITLRQIVNYLAVKRKKHVLCLPIPFNITYILLKMAEIMRLGIGLRSDSLLGLQFINNHIDFTPTRNIDVIFHAVN